MTHTSQHTDTLSRKVCGILFFCFTLLDILYIHQAIFLPFPPLATPQDYSYFWVSPLYWSSGLFISHVVGGGVQHIEDFQIFVEQMICLGDSSLLETSSILGNPLLRFWLPVAVWYMCVCVHDLCELSLSLFLPLWNKVDHFHHLGWMWGTRDLT